MMKQDACSAAADALFSKR